MSKRDTITDPLRVSSFGFNSSFVIRFSSFMRIRVYSCRLVAKKSLLILLRFGRLRFLRYRIHFYRRFPIHAHRSHDMLFIHPCHPLIRGYVRIMPEHSGFQKLVAEAKKNITEISPQDAAAKLNSDDAVVVDVRDKDEWDEGHIPGATHMSRGTIELDIEEKVPDPNAMIICHCGGGGRSALAAETLQKMGYKNVRSMAGGLKAWKAAGLATTT